MGSSTSRLLLLVALARAAAARELPPPSDTGFALKGPQKVIGQVVRPGQTDVIPVPGIWVTLHRVGSDAQAPLDSVRADSNGRYEFNFRRTGEEGAIYFISATYGGIAYFTPPLAHSTVSGAEAEIAVFDTTSGPVPIGVRGHHIVVSAVDQSARRTVTEVFELANDSSVTRVRRPGSAGAVWSTVLPTGASNFSVTQGDIPAAAVAFAGGRARVYAPIAPGMRQLAFNYTMSASAFPLTVPVGHATQVLEVLIEEERGSVNGAGLKETSPVSLERRSFRRFLADDVDGSASVTIDLPRAGARARHPAYMIAITAAIGGVMAFALVRALRRK